MKSWLGGIAIIIFCFLFFPSTVSATQTYQVGNTLFTDDFNDGNFSGWTVQSGTWGIDSLKRLYGIDSGVLKSGNISPVGSWANYRVEADVQNDNGVDEGINFRYVNGANTYALNLRHHITVPNTDTPEIKLLKAVNNVTTTVASTHNVILEHFITYKVKIEVVGEHIQVWVDNNLIFDLDDPETPLQTGGIALAYWSGTNGSINVRFDNIKVTALSPIPKTPVIFIPGIGGSELKLNQATTWSADNGHGGTYSHDYSSNENIWLNQTEAAKLGDDDYFDILRMKSNGTDSAADITTTGNLLTTGYPGIDSYFTGLGYTKNVDYFLFPYDWRRDVSSNNSALSTIIQTAQQSSGKSKVNILAHSLGGLLARSYINEGTNSAKINKLIELGVPHLGSVKAIQYLLYGDQFTKQFLYFIPIGIPSSEVKDVFQNAPTIFQLIPSKKYYDLHPPEYSWAFYPFSDERDLDQNGETGILDYSHLKTLLGNQGINMPVYQFGESLHASLDDKYSTSTGIPIYLCVGNGFPTLGQIRETYRITWPVKLFPYTDQIYINGDDTVPSGSAALKNIVLDLSAGATIYYSNQQHNDLANPSGGCMQQATNWLKDSPATTPDSTPSSLDGTQINTDNDSTIEITDSNGRLSKINSDSELELNIPGTIIDKVGATIFSFINKSVGTATVSVKSTQSSPTNITIKKYQSNIITQTYFYQNLNLSTPATITINPSSPDPTISILNLSINPSGSATGSAALDTTPPVTTASITGTKESTNSYSGTTTISLSATDASGSGIMKTYYSLDPSSTPSAYLNPISFTTPGTYTLKYGSTDNLGNDEITKSLTLTIVASPTTSSTSSTTSSNTGGTSDTSTQNSNSTSTTPNSDSNTSNPVTDSIKNSISSVLPSLSIKDDTVQAVLGTKTYTIKFSWLKCLQSNYQNLLNLFGFY